MFSVSKAFQQVITSKAKDKQTKVLFLVMLVLIFTFKTLQYISFHTLQFSGSIFDQGGSYFSEIHNFTMGIPASCFILLTGFRTVFVFALGRFVPVVVNFLSPQSIQKGKNGKKKQNFKIGLKPTQNCETPKTKVSFTILGGYWH